MRIKFRYASILFPIALVVYALSNPNTSVSVSSGVAFPNQANTVHEKNKKGGLCSPKDNQTIYIPLIGIPEAEGGELVFNSRSPKTIEVTPTFYKYNGQAIRGDSVEIKSSEIRYVDIKKLLPKQHRGAKNLGGLTLSYFGSNREMWAQYRLVGINGGDTVDEFFTVKAEARSASYDAVWWMPAESAALVALGNITDEPTSAKIIFGNGTTQIITLRPHATDVIKTAQSHNGPQSVRIEVTGPAGSVIPTGLVTTRNGSFNSAIRFYDSSAAMKAGLFATGVRLAGATPHLVLKNTSYAPIRTSPEIIPNSGRSALLRLPEVEVGAHQAVEIDLSSLREAMQTRPDLDVVSVEIPNDAEPGTLIGSFYSVDRSSGKVYEAPLRDSGPVRNMTGVYPWKLTDDYKTVVYITNISDSESEFAAQINSGEDKFAIGRRKLNPGETAVFDLEKIRDSQEMDVMGNRLPRDATLGQFRWGIFGITNGGTKVIGRAEMVSRTDNVSTSYSCQTDCAPFYVADINPSPPATVYPGSSTQTTAYWTALFYELPQIGPIATTATWTLSNGVATVDAFAETTTVKGVSPGGADLEVYLFDAQRFRWDGLMCIDDGQYSVETMSSVSVGNVSVDEVGFSSDHKITRSSNGTVIDDTDGTTPTWKRTSNPDDPVAYTKSANPTMFAKLNISPSMSSTNVSIRVKNGSTVIATKSATLSGANVTVTGITTSSASESTVKATTPSFTWEISYDGGTTWGAAGTTGSHKMYWTNATPLSPSFRNDAGSTFSPLYDLALQKATGYANGASTLTSVIENINAGVDTDITYNPSVSIGNSHPLLAYSTGGGVQCSDLANLLRGLLRSIGIDGTTLYIWAGANSSTLTRYTYTGGTGPSFRISRGAHDGAGANPHFKFHAVVSTNSTWYDPSYNLSYSSLSFTETANNNTPQQVHSTLWSNDVLSGFTCPH